MKTGANIIEQNQIRRLSVEGFTTEEISRQLKIIPKCVQSFLDHFGLPAPAEPEVETEPEDDTEGG